MVLLALVEAQRPGERDKHPLRRRRTPLLLDSAVVVGRHPGQHRHLLAPQPAGAAPLPAGKPDILRLQRLTTRSEKIRQQRPVHRPTSSVRQDNLDANRRPDEGQF